MSLLESVSWRPLLWADPLVGRLPRNNMGSETGSDICCDLTFHADSGLILNLEHLYIIDVLTHANATIMFKDYRCSL